MVWRCQLYLFDTLNSFLLFCSIFSLFLPSTSKIFDSEWVCFGFVYCLTFFFTREKKFSLQLQYCSETQKFRNSSVFKFSNDILMHILMHTYIL